MSTQDQVAPDVRYTTNKLPAHLGSDPSEETLKNWFSDYGWVWLHHITNNSGNTVTFNNPYGDNSGDIAPGETRMNDNQGYIPYWSNSKRYEITCYNKAFNAWKNIRIKDLAGNWWLSFDHDGDDEDIRTIRPIPYDLRSIFNLTINESGYEVYNASLNKRLGSIAFLPK